MKSKNYAVILASGNSQRLNNLREIKQFVKIAGKTVIEHTIDIFEKNKQIDEIIIVTRNDYITYCQELVVNNGYKKITNILQGGNTRQESSAIAVSSINGNENDNVLIHDAVRPFLTDDIIYNCISKLDSYGAVDVAIDSADTIIKVNENNIIESIPQRKYLKRGQTPQAFKLGIIQKAHIMAKKTKNISVTDDCGLIKLFNLSDIYVVNGSDFNIKITYPLDIDIADKLFQIRTFEIPNVNLSNINNKVIVIFGASKGIGKSIADICKQHKAKIYGFSRQNNIDVTNPKDVKSALKEIYKKEKKIDYVINTAGILKMGKLENKEYSDIEQEIAINYMGNIIVLKESIPYLKKSKGSILMFTSSSYTRGRSEYSIYSSTKAALVNLMQAVSQEHINDGIKINIMNPERTATQMRYDNFGEENSDTLLKPSSVAIASLLTILSELTGQVINVTLDKEKDLQKLLYT